MKLPIFFTSLLFLACGMQAQKAPMIELVTNKAEQKVEVLIDGQLFTAFLQPADVKKPVLWPVVSPGGNDITRSYPLKKKAGERVDHPHHIGIWFNYGDVNGLDFWNNSDAIKPEKAANYGTIQLQKIKKAKGGKGEGQLVTVSNWDDPSGKTLLEEKTEFHFSATDKVRIIDRTATLTAKADQVTFHDNKEGMFAIRVTRALELPTKEDLQLSDAQGNITRVAASDQSEVSGDYLSSEGITGGKVWGTRGKWMKLSGTVNGEKVAVVIYDHPGNVGYPTYWHAREYGLFSANTLGQKVFSKGEKELNFSLKKGESTTFKYRMAIFTGNPSAAEIEKLANF